MSFDVNIGKSEPVIKPASNMNNDGGSGGNLGYMMRERKKKKKEDSELLFSKDKSFDTFELSTGFGMKKTELFEDDKPSWIKSILIKFKK